MWLKVFLSRGFGAFAGTPEVAVTAGVAVAAVCAKAGEDKVAIISMLTIIEIAIPCMAKSLLNNLVFIAYPRIPVFEQKNLANLLSNLILFAPF